MPLVFIPHGLTAAHSLSALSLILSKEPRNSDPPELILSFETFIAPPTYVACQVNSTPVNIAVLSREVTAGLYNPPSTASPVTNVNVTLRTRQAGKYHCTVSVYRSSGGNLTDVKTSPLPVLGQTAAQMLHEIM